jgi:hypothetical protein
MSAFRQFCHNFVIMNAYLVSVTQFILHSIKALHPAVSVGLKYAQRNAYGQRASISFVQIPGKSGDTTLFSCRRFLLARVLLFLGQVFNSKY